MSALAFDPWAALKTQPGPHPPPNPPKVPNPPPSAPSRLGGLGEGHPPRCDSAVGAEGLPPPAAAALAGAYAAPDVLADRQAIAEEPPARPVPPSAPPPELVERLAAALAVDRPWQRSTGPAAAGYWRSQARRRLDRLDPAARGLLVQGEEAAARRWAAVVTSR